MVARLMLCLLAAPLLRAEPLLLKGFQLVDPATRTVSKADVYMEDGKLARPRGSLAGCSVVEGQGRFLIPALWDMKASLWGNESGKDYRELYQELGISQSLRIQLFYGVAHVGGACLDRAWVMRELMRADAMQFAAAGLIFPDKALGAADCPAWGCFPLSQTAQVGPLLDGLKSKAVPYIHLSYVGADDPMPGVSRPVLEAAIQAAHQRGLKVWVTFATWAQAADAVAFGADLVHGMGEGDAPEALIRRMRSKHCAFSPRLAYFLDPPRLVGHGDALGEPYLADSVPADILDSFRDPAGIWKGWDAVLAFGRKNEAVILKNVRRMADAGVTLVSSTDAGWALGTFHGYSTHRNQVWMEKAGVDAWTRLKYATQWPAEFIGRHVGFHPGADADFVALDADPLQGADQLRKISFVIRRGELVQRGTLKPDMTRTKFRP